jgi:hypothetical protein
MHDVTNLCNDRPIEKTQFCWLLTAKEAHLFVQQESAQNCNFIRSSATVWNFGSHNTEGTHDEGVWEQDAEGDDGGGGGLNEGSKRNLQQPSKWGVSWFVLFTNYLYSSPTICTVRQTICTVRQLSVLFANYLYCSPTICTVRQLFVLFTNYYSGDQIKQ